MPKVILKYVYTWTAFLLVIYINPQCNCGPHLQRDKIKQLPRSFGPGTLSQVLGAVVQSLIDASLQTKQTFSILRTRQGDGETVVRGNDFQKSKILSLSVKLTFLKQNMRIRYILFACPQLMIYRDLKLILNFFAKTWDIVKT